MVKRAIVWAAAVAALGAGAVWMSGCGGELPPLPEPPELGHGPAGSLGFLRKAPGVRDHQPHPDRGRVPAGRAESAEERLLGQRLVQVERLRIVLGGKGFDFLGEGVARKKQELAAVEHVQVGGLLGLDVGRAEAVVEEGDLDRNDNPLKRAPHTAAAVTATDWAHPYSRETAAFPDKWTRASKFWPSVGRVDNVYGDRNLF